MKSILETGTDAAMVCFFDSHALPPDFDQRSADDPIGVIESLQQDQRFWFGGDGDGTYTFHTYVDEPLPDVIAAHGVSVGQFEDFQIPSGELWFCGVEYVANSPVEGSSTTPPGGLAGYSREGQSIVVTPGRYRVQVLRCEWTDDERSENLKRAMPANLRASYRLEQAFLVVAGISLVLGVVALAFSAFMCVALICITAYNWFFQPEMISRLPTVLAVWGPIALGGLAATTLGWWIARSFRGSGAGQIAEAARRELPEFAVVLELVDERG